MKPPQTAAEKEEALKVFGWTLGEEHHMKTNAIVYVLNHTTAWWKFRLRSTDRTDAIHEGWEAFKSLSAPSIKI